MSRIFIEQGSTPRKLLFMVRDKHGILYEREMAPKDTGRLRSFCVAAEIDPEDLLAAAERFKAGEVFLHPDANADPKAADAVADIDMGGAIEGMPAWGGDQIDDARLDAELAAGAEHVDELLGILPGRSCDDPPEGIDCGSSEPSAEAHAEAFAAQVDSGEITIIEETFLPEPSAEPIADDVDVSEPEEDKGPAFPESGSNVRDHLLAEAGVRMPAIEQPGGETGWAANMGLADSGNGKGSNGNGDGADAEALEEPIVVEPFDIRIRGRYSKATTAIRLTGETAEAAIYKALEREELPDEAVIEWSGTHRLACLDLDWHHGAPPDEASLDVLINRVSPWPALYWRSHGGGAHLLYHELEGFTAQELASSAAIAFLDRCPAGQRPTVEILSRTAHPDKPRGVRMAGQVYGLDQSVARLLDGWRQGVNNLPDESAIREWLDNHGLEIGRRYDHDHCPFDPCSAGGSGSPPVVVTDVGVMCYRCKGKGHRSKGWRSFSRLCGAYTNSRVLDAAEAMVYYEHAQHLLREEYPAVPDQLLAPAWSAFLKLTAGETLDPRVPRAMVPKYVVRGVGGVWLDSTSFRPVSPKVGIGVTMGMPSAMFCKRTEKLDKEGNVVEILLSAEIDKDKHDLHRTDQAIAGFPEIVPVPGVRLWGQHNSYPSDGIRVAIPPKHGDQPALYVPEDERMPLADAWGHIEKHYPGVDRAYLELLIVARGFAESGTGPVPMLMVTGPTGAAKSTTVDLAAAIVGDVCVPIKEVERERFQEALGQRTRTSGFLLLDEFGKDIPPSRSRALFAMLLDITRHFTYRANYTGPTHTYFNSVLVLTNNAYGQDVRQNAQLGRRLVKIHLGRRADAWEVTCGTRDVRYWRTKQANAEAANSFLSYIVDKYLPENCTRTFAEVARDLGFEMLEQAAQIEGGISVEDTVRELFALVCASSSTPLKRWKGTGWVAVEFEDTSDLANCWRLVCDDPSNMDGFSDSMRIDELDLATILGASEEVRVERIRHGRRLGLRFVSGASRGRAAATAKYNEQITTPTPLTEDDVPDIDMTSFEFPDFGGDQ